MHRYLLRLRHGQRMYYLFFATLSFIMTGCQVSAPVETPTAASRPDYVLTVMLQPGDTRAEVEKRYGGEVVVWQAGAYAVVGLDTALATQSVAVGEDEWANLTLEQSKDAFLAGGEIAWMNGRTRIWAGGRTRIWAGGRTRIWAGGDAGLWENGQFAWLPENTAIWNRVRLEQGQALAKNLGYGVKVAVIDTGVDLNHPALIDALAPASEWHDFYSNDTVPQEEGDPSADGYGHGTNVAGIIRQVAPGAIILPIRILGPDGEGDVAHLTAAIQWATDKGAQVINLSLGSDEKIKAVEEAIKWANKQGVFVVASTGNSGDDLVTFPASKAHGGPGRMRTSVTSLNLMDAKSDFATFGKTVELGAPGERVFGPAPDLQLAAWTGTSQAAPMASGALALALGETLTVDPRRLSDELMKSADDLYADRRNEVYKNDIGRGRLNIEAFITKVTQ